jgi:hypothetical protein
MMNAQEKENMMKEQELFDKARDFFYGDENVDAYKMEDELINNGVDVDLVWELLDELLGNVVKAAITPKFPDNQMSTITESQMNFVGDVIMPTE